MNASNPPTAGLIEMHRALRAAMAALVQAARGDGQKPPEVEAAYLRAIEAVDQAAVEVSQLKATLESPRGRFLN
jgi:hypothetical protein